MRRRALLAAALALPACAQARSARLSLLDVIEMDTAPWGFGGFSAVHLAADLTVTMVSDRGRWWQAPLRLAPPGFGPARHGPLLDAAGRPLRGRAGDAEALVRLPDGSWLVGFEREHRIQRHLRLDGPALPFPAPPGLAESPANGGLEALALLPDGRLLAIAESPGTRAWLGSDGTWAERRFQPAPGLLPVDAAALPGGGALVLERDFSLLGGFRGRLAFLPDPAAPLLAGETWLEMPGGIPAENWEGVAAARTREGALVVLVSDDNQSPFQRSLFAVFRLEER
ncbi:esterase-like activity of phytase family protein [Roseococcus sp. DSY-14]|uniref:esterase-like activity of phytase family protein n=1 Tax=Roseococcus sp. DSY-14 TaxID=3369650 RepID=UPI00387A9309